MKRRFWGKWIAGCVLVSFISVLVVPLASWQASAAENNNNSYLPKVMEFIKNRYNYDVSDRLLYENSIKGMFGSLDDYSEFYSREEAEQFLESVDGSYEGIGIALSEDQGFIVVTRVFPSSPAESAGLLSGDRIVSVNGEDVTGISVDEATVLIRGEKGTRVTLGIGRNGSKDVKEISVERNGIKMDPVSYEIRDGIGYVTIESFNANTDEYLEKALNALDNSQVGKIVLDLRDNTGGEVLQAVEAARHFVPAGTITTLKFRVGDDITYKSFLTAPKYKVVVLVNGMTASASEILSGAIQDSKAGILVGSKTYGKARVQSVIPLLTPEAYQKYARQYGDVTVDANDLAFRHGVEAADNEIEGWAKITTGTYLTPAGRFIDGQGLEPDIKIGDPAPVRDIEVRNIEKLTKINKPALNSSDMDVYYAEKILKVCDYDVNKPDLNLDQKTLEAIKKFQINNGLYPSGVLDYATQDAFNKLRLQLLTRYDLQYARACAYLTGK
ncbi:MAG: S41 family peptidase [Syntrophomonas sp.]